MNDLRLYLRAVVPGSKLTVGDRLVLHVLATYANDTGHAWPSSRTLHDACGMHPDVIRRCLSRLVRAGVIYAERRTGRSTVYRFPLHPSTTCDPSVTGGSALPVTDGSQVPSGPVTEESRTCDRGVTDLWPTGHTERSRSTKEEERARGEPVDNSGIPDWLAERWADRL